MLIFRFITLRVLSVFVIVQCSSILFPLCLSSCLFKGPFPRYLLLLVSSHTPESAPPTVFPIGSVMFSTSR